LVGIGRVICRDDVVLKHRPLNAFIEHECSKLDLLLNECLSNAKVAKSHTVLFLLKQTKCKLETTSRKKTREWEKILKKIFRK